MYFDDGGNPVVMATSQQQRDNAVAYASNLLRSRQLSLAPVAFRVVEFDFESLNTWFEQASSRLLGTSGVVLIDVDEVENRVEVGVENSDLIPTVTSELRGLGIPAAAVAVTIESPVSFRQHLDSLARPSDGGYKIDNLDDFAGYCTLGFNTIWNGDPAFVTASHCTPAFHTNDAGRFSQPSGFGRQIGSEIHDATLFGGFWSWGGASGFCNSSPPSCSFADATVSLYHDTVTSRVGHIAKTTSWGLGGRGSESVTGTWKIFNKLGMVFMPVNTWISKVGATSGWTRGQILRTCVNIASGGSTRLCQWETSTWSEPGDSGSPMFLDSNQHPPSAVTNVHLAGVLWGGPPTNFNVTWFSPIEAVDHEFGVALPVCAPPNSC
jgi:hypothetical protein